MKRIFSISAFGVFLFLITMQTNISSCTKKLETDTLFLHDTLVINDTLVVKDTVKVDDSCILKLQPNFNLDEMHYFGSSTIDESDPNSPEIGAASWTSYGSPVNMRATLKFDLSDLPANATIVSAKLTLYSDPTPLNGNLIDANYGSDNAMLIQRVTSAWDMNSRWNSQPSADTTGQIIIPHTDQSTLDLVDIDVTSLIQKMFSTTNYGFMLKLQNEAAYNSRLFCSSKYSEYSKHPKLMLIYKH